jgi:diguanylate cyclase (GGDEF)-like protein
MSKLAWLYIWGVLLAGGTLAGLALALPFPSATDWEYFLLLTSLATLSQLFKAEAPNHRFYYATLVFQFAGVLSLHPLLLMLLMVIPHAIEWAKARLTNSKHLQTWYIQPSNIATHIISSFTARWVFVTLSSGSESMLSFSTVSSVCAAAVTYVILNHFLTGLAIVLVRRISFRESGILTPDSILTDLVLLMMGYTVAIMWQHSMWLVLLSLLPLVLIYRALKIPQLKREAQTDEKTGLWNARHVANLFATELERAQRYKRPLALIMADLDLLRNINNTYGHMAGDTVLSNIGRIIRENVREYDIAGRFGGEEFAIVLPEATPEEAQAVAERLREAVEKARYDVSTSQTPISATMSIGISCFPHDATTTINLLHEADVAVYRAKLNGRNCVVCASDVPQSLDLGNMPTMPAEDRLAAPYAAAFVPRPAAVDRGTPTPVSAHVVQPPPTDNRHVALTTASLAPAEVAAMHGRARPQEGKQPVAQAAPGRSKSDKVLVLYVASVIAAGITSTALGFSTHPQIDLVALCLIVTLATLAELLQVNLYGPETMSVSVAAMFAAALVAGVPGVACACAANVLVNYMRRRTALYKVAFNWATHVLAGMVPVLVMEAIGLPLRMENLFVLGVPIVLSSLAYYAVDTGLIATAIGLSSGASTVNTWRERFQWLAGHYVVLCIMGLFLGVAYAAQGPVGLVVFAMPIAMMRFSQKQYIERTEDSVRELQRMNAELTHANQEVVEASAAMQQLNEELFLTLSRIIDARDPYVGGHAAQVADYATAIAGELGLSPERMEPLRQAGFLHDIGKIAISEAILHKPAKLTDEEYEYIKTHAPLGGEFLEMCRGLRHLAPFVRHHHERWDGRGYPDKLKADEIPLEARILAVCDSAEAMASDRPYHKAMPLSEVIAEVKRCAGTQFDPAVAAAFVTVAEREREHLVVNSAREVQKKRSESTDTSHLISGGLKTTRLTTGPLHGVTPQVA